MFNSIENFFSYMPITGPFLYKFHNKTLENSTQRLHQRIQEATRNVTRTSERRVELEASRSRMDAAVTAVNPQEEMNKVNAALANPPSVGSTNEITHGLANVLAHTRTVMGALRSAKNAAEEQEQLAAKIQADANEVRAASEKLPLDKKLYEKQRVSYNLLTVVLAIIAIAFQIYPFLGSMVLGASSVALFYSVRDFKKLVT